MKKKNEEPYILNVVCIYMEGNNLKHHGRTSETALTHREGKDAKKNQRPSMSYEKKTV